MKKHYVIASLIFFSCSALSAQTFVCSPANSMSGSAPLNVYTNFNIDMVNQTSDTMTLAWDLVSNTLHGDWDYSLCDYTACYTVLPASGVMSPNYSSNSFLKLTLNPMYTKAAGTLKFWVYDYNNPSSGDSVTFHVSSINVGLEEGLTSKIALYPNPAADYIHVNADVKALEFFDASGVLVLASEVMADNQKISTSELSAGLYMVKLTLLDGSTELTKVVIEN